MSNLRTLVFAFGHDEEISGKEGVGKLAERMRELGWHFAWMVDEGGMLISDNPLLPHRLLAIVNVTENPALNSTEEWDIYNFTVDAHPIHLHLVNFEILDRQDFEYDITGKWDDPVVTIKKRDGAEDGQRGRK